MRKHKKKKPFTRAEKIAIAVLILDFLKWLFDKILERI